MAEAKSRSRDRQIKRRKPQQSRSAKSVAAMLDAAGRVLERDGLITFSTASVAKEADVSIGALYQYFENKHQLLFALAERWFARLRIENVDYRRAEFIDEAFRVYSDEPGNAALMEAIVAIPELRSYSEQCVETIALSIAESLAPNGRKPTQKELTTARMVSYSMNAVLVAATKAEKKESDMLVQSLKKWVMLLTATWGM